MVTLTIALLRRRNPARGFNQLRLRVRSFWFIVVLATLALGFSRWFSIVCIAFISFVGIIPIARKRGADSADPLAECYAALLRGEILIIFPEGTRGEPERMQELKSGVAVLASKFPEVPVVPIFMHGLGRAMPRGAFVPVPFFVDVYAGQAMQWDQDSAGGDKKAFMAALATNMRVLGEKHERPEFD